MKTYFKKGAWNAICDVCGFQFKSTEMRERWDGMMVCHDDYETRHPMDLYKPNLDEHYPEWTRPEQE